MQPTYENKEKFLKCLKLYFGLGLYYLLNVTTIIMIHLKTNEKMLGYYIILYMEQANMAVERA